MSQGDISGVTCQELHFRSRAYNMEDRRRISGSRILGEAVRGPPSPLTDLRLVIPAPPSPSGEDRVTITRDRPEVGDPNTVGEDVDSLAAEIRRHLIKF